MEKTTDPLLGAIEEVTSVAEELRALQKRVKQYSDASKRLQEVSDALLQLTGCVSKMENTFIAVLDKAENARAQLEVSRAAADAMVQSIPEVVRRIEASDVSKSIAEFSAPLGEVRRLIELHQRTMVDIQSTLIAEQQEQATIVKEVGDRSEKILSFVGRLSTELQGIKAVSSQQAELLQTMNQTLTDNVVGPVSGNGRLLLEMKSLLDGTNQVTNKTGTAMANFGIEMMREMAAMRCELSSTKLLIEKNSGQLDVIGKKRGLLF